MAVIQPVIVALPVSGQQDGWSVQWPHLQNGDTGQPVQFLQHHDRSVQVAGTFGAGGICRIEGSNDGVNFSVLRDPSSTALNITNAELIGVLEAAWEMRPNITGGDGTTDLTVTAFVRRTQ